VGNQRVGVMGGLVPPKWYICFFVSYPAAAPRMGEIFGKASLRKNVWRRRSVDGMMIDVIFSVAQDVRESPIVRK
jgi:hypothetical protein